MPIFSGNMSGNPSVVSTTLLSRGGTVTFPVLPGTAPSLSTGRAGFSPVSCFQSCRHRSLISAFWQPGKRFPQKPGIFRLAQNAGNAVSGQSAVPVQLSKKTKTPAGIHLVVFRREPLCGFVSFFLFPVLFLNIFYSAKLVCIGKDLFLRIILFPTPG